MKGDFSRLLQDPARHDDAWLQQQGRVWLDSDWNEAALARLRLLELQLIDLAGPTGRPVASDAFRISAGATGDFRLGAGRLYVDGLLCRNDARSSYRTQPDLPGAPDLPAPAADGAGWSLADEMREGRAGHVAVTLAAGRRVLVAGGWHDGAPSPTAEVYDDDAGQWRRAEAMRVARVGHGGARLPDGRVLVAGGSGAGGIGLRSAELFDPDSRTWSRADPMARARSFFATTVLQDGRVLVTGGADGGEVLAGAELFDPATGSWTALPPMAGARALHSATLLPDGRVVVAGGRAPAGPTAAAEMLDAGSWATIAPLAEARERHTATLVPAGVLVAGGATAAGGRLASVELWGLDGGWLPRAALAVARSDHAAARLADGSVLVTGGLTAAGATATTERHHPALNTWSGGSLAERRLGHTASVLAGPGDLLVAGGAVVGGGWLPPEPPEVPSVERLAAGPSTTVVAYIEAWRRLIGYQQDDTREIALGGPDTTVRLRTVAQVRFAPVPRAHQPANLECEHARAYLPRPGGGRLSTVSTAPPPPEDECEIPADGAYTGRENRLYRVELLDGGEMLGAPRPDGLALASAAATGARRLELAPPVSGIQRASLAREPWVLRHGVGDAAREELLLVDGFDGATGVRLAMELRHPYPAGATLARVETAVALTAAAGAGTSTLRVAPERAGELVPATGALARRGWFLRGGAAPEALGIVGVDTASGVITLAAPLTESHPLGAELVPRARFTWSRSNAAFAVRVRAVPAADAGAAGAAPSTTLRLDGLGRDSETALRYGDVVELVGDRAELGPGRGLLARVSSVPDPDELTLSVDLYRADLDPALAPGDPQLVRALAADKLVLRRWDGVAFVRADEIDLGDGVRVAFSGGDFRAGDYWWFTTRTADGRVQALDAAPPDGVQRHRVPLGIVRWTGGTGGGLHAVDCIPDFDPLTALRAERIAYDDHRCDLRAANVQEALDILCARDAADIPYDDRACRLGASTVQDAIDALCRRQAWPVVAAIDWRNDRPMSVAEFRAGLEVEFSEDMAAATLSDATFIVSVEVPTGNGASVSVLPAGAVTSTPRTCRFVPSSESLDRLLDDAAGAERMRCRVVLKGDKILDAAGERPLDGDVIGRLARDGYELYTDLELPSGDHTVGGDFESWFYLAPPPAPVRVSDVRPQDGDVLAEVPSDVMVTFGREVRLATLTPQSFFVADDTGFVVSGGAVHPFPFAPGMESADRVTLDLDNVPEALRTRLLDRDVSFEVRVRGTGGDPVRDLDGNALDGAGTGNEGSDFVSRFAVARRVAPPAPQDPRLWAWAMGSLDADGLADLFVIRTEADPAAQALLQVLSADSSYQSVVEQAPLPIRSGDVEGGVWGTGDTQGDGVADLLVIQTAGPGGLPAVTVLSGADGYQSARSQELALSRPEAIVGWAIGQSPGTGDVQIAAIEGGIARASLRVHLFSSADEFASITRSSDLDLVAAGAMRRTWLLAPLTAGGPCDLLAVDLPVTARGVAVHVFDGASGFTQQRMAARMPITALELGEHRWTTGDANGDGVADLCAIRFAPQAGGAPRLWVFPGPGFTDLLPETELPLP